MYVDVTQDDIVHGEANSATRCPLARALRRKYPNARITVGTQVADIYMDNGEAAFYRLSFLAREFVDAIDAGDLADTAPQAGRYRLYKDNS